MKNFLNFCFFVVVTFFVATNCSSFQPIANTNSEYKVMTQSEKEEVAARVASVDWSKVKNQVNIQSEIAFYQGCILDPKTKNYVPDCYNTGNKIRQKIDKAQDTLEQKGLHHTNCRPNMYQGMELGTTCSLTQPYMDLWDVKSNFREIVFPWIRGSKCSYWSAGHQELFNKPGYKPCIK